MYNTLPSLQMVVMKLLVAKGNGGLRQGLPVDSNPVWEAQGPPLRGEQTWDLGPAWMPSPMIQLHSLLFSTWLGQRMLDPSGISGSMPGRD